MQPSYRNYSTDELMNQKRNINFANAEMLYGRNNAVKIDLDIALNEAQLIGQADIFARQMMSNKARFDFKRVLGPYNSDWQRLLHEVYVYDRLKCLYYGLNSNQMSSFPRYSYSFPGNILLMNAIKERYFSFSTEDAQPYNIFINVENTKSFEELTEDIFKQYPEMKFGLSDTKNVFVYQNDYMEGILTGLHEALLYMNTKKGGVKDLFSLKVMDDNTIPNFFLKDSFPLVNSFLSENGENFYFIMPTVNSGPESLRHNESIFVSRAIGFVSKKISFIGNDIYKNIIRDNNNDPLLCNDVVSVTGLITDLPKISDDEIRYYLNLNSYKVKPQGGTGNNPVPPY